MPKVVVGNKCDSDNQVHNKNNNNNKSNNKYNIDNNKSNNKYNIDNNKSNNKYNIDNNKSNCEMIIVAVKGTINTITIIKIIIVIKRMMKYNSLKLKVRTIMMSLGSLLTYKNNDSNKKKNNENKKSD